MGIQENSVNSFFFIFFRLYDDNCKQQTFCAEFAIIDTDYQRRIVMGEIWDKVTIKGTKKDKEMDAFFDTGATYNHINEDVAKEVGVIMLNKVLKTDIADGSQIDSELGVGFVTIKGCKIPAFFSVKKKGAVPLTIGHVTMQVVKARIDLEHDAVQITCPAEFS